MSMEPKKTVLIVEDEKNIVDIVRFNLQREGYATLEAYDGEAGLALAREKKPDLILLDVMMPKMMGFDVCRALRAEGDNVPVIILTAREEEEDKILGLEYGADDYMTKPFNILEVKARIKTIFRRTMMQRETSQRVITVRDLKLNMNNRSVSIGDRDVNLTAKEFDLLQLFVTNRGKVFSRESLLETIWKYDYLGDLRTVDVHIRRLREKIEKVPSQPEYIFTKWGVGYYFTDKD